MKPERAKFLTGDELRRLFRAARTSGRDPDRDYLLLVLAHNLGLRVSEAVAVRWEDLHLSASPPFARVWTRKRRTKRATFTDLPLEEKLAKLLRSRTVRHLAPSASDGFLFPGRYTWQGPRGHLTDRAAREIFRYCARVAGLDSQLSFHSLRHSLGVRVWEATQDLKLVSELLRHNRLKNTEVYIHLSPERQAALARRLGSVL